MINMDEEKLKKIHSVLLEMLSEIDRICRAHGIEYTLDGGTMLGAVRHKGFIPWDDDADVVMTRDNYDKFFEACRTDLDHSKYFLQDYTTDPYYRWGYSKLRKLGTKGVLAGHENEKWNNGIFIDLFVMDNVPDGYLARKKFAVDCFFIRKGQYSTVGCKNKAINPVGRAGFKFLSLFSREHWFNKLQRMYTRNNAHDTELITHMTWPYPGGKIKYGVPAEWFRHYIDVPFEDRTFRIIKDYDPYLSLVYGDYMTPPPPDHRAHYDFVELDFGDNS